jgi:hypothetical protein
MIRLAFFGVFAIAGLLAFGAFFLARGTGSNGAQAIAPAPTLQSVPEVEPVPDVLMYFLSDVDTASGTITIVLRDQLTGQGDMVVRDQAAIKAARTVAYINTTPSGGEVLGMVAMAMMGASPKETVLQIYRDDVLISAVECTSTTCGRFASDRDADLGPLLGAAQPLILEQSFAENYDDYLADLDAVTQSPDYMFLDLRPENAAPQVRQTARMDLFLPTLSVSAGTSIDPSVTSALARSIVNPLLPEGANINGVTFMGTGAGIVTDMDSGTQILAGGAQIAFPAVEFTNVKVSIEGTSDFDDAALQTLTEQPLSQFDYAQPFADFVRDRLQSDCADCFAVKVNGDHYTMATVTVSEPEGYRLDYYDLRDPP